MRTIPAEGDQIIFIGLPGTGSTTRDRPDTATIDERLRFEQLISDLASNFINLPAFQIDQEIENTLHKIAGFFQADRSTIFHLSGKQHTLEALYTFTSEGIRPSPELDADKDYPWCWRKLVRGKVIVIASPDQLPVEAAVDKENMTHIGVQSFIGIPVRIRGIFRYVFTIVCLKHLRAWDPQLVRRVQLVGQLLSHALHRKEMERNLARQTMEIRQFRLELSHRDRIGSIGALTAAIAHEINQPLAAILSNAQAAQQLLTRQPPDLEEIRLILSDIVDADKRASDVIQNIRCLLKKDEGHYEYCNATDLVEKAVQLIASEAVLRQMIITTDLPPHLPPVFCDPVLIQQVLINLLINAMDAMKDDERPARIMIRTRAEGAEWIGFHVCDSGPGISESTKNALLMPFSSSKTGGLGIGLILCHSIIESHGGSMAIENQPHGGARVSFLLPARGTGSPDQQPF